MEAEDSILQELLAAESFRRLSREDDYGLRGPQVRTLYKSHQGISIHCETAILSDWLGAYFHTIDSFTGRFYAP